MEKFAKLLGDAYAHRNHRPTRAKRRDDIVALLQGQASPYGDRFLPLAGKSLGRDLSFMLPADERVFEKAGDEHVAIKAPLDAGLLIVVVRVIS